jgi:hypothetical protein
MKLKQQKGFSILNLILIIVFIGVFGILGFQIGMGYLDQSAIKSAVKQTLLDAKNNENMKEREIAGNITRQVALNSIDLSIDSIYVTKNGNQSYNVEVEYNKEIKVTKTIKIVMDLNFAEETR